MKKYIILSLFLCALVSTVSAQFPLLNDCPQTSTFSGNTRGYWFTAPVDFVITEALVPTTASTGNASVAIMRFNAGTPPFFSASTTNYTTLFLAQNVAGSAPIPTGSISVTAGDVIGVLGSRGGAVNSYGSGGCTTSINGTAVTVNRLLMQSNLASTWPFAVSTENSSIGRIELTVQPAVVAPVPTLSQWGLILLGLVILILGVVVVWRRKFMAVQA